MFTHELESTYGLQYCNRHTENDTQGHMQSRT